MCDVKIIRGDDATATSVVADKFGERLLPLKTTLEVRAGDSLVHAYITKVPLKAANSILSHLRQFSKLNSLDLQHLRRIVPLEKLPAHLQSALGSPLRDIDSGKCIKELVLLISPTCLIGVPAVKDCLLMTSLWEESNLPAIHTVVVPLLAPTSQEQAQSWSLTLWPTVYKKNNPFGPHPSVVSRAESVMEKEVFTWMSMAKRAALISQKQGHGEAIGAVVVERTGDSARAVALAGDGRWKNEHKDQQSTGNVFAHAVLRGISMVARKLRTNDPIRSDEHGLLLGDGQQNGLFLDVPLNREEQEVFDNGPLSSDGYLCHNLEIYLTHEPCVMCSMAILHSRFGRVVFGHRMPSTGALTSELATQDTLSCRVALGHGLFWRKELNWCLLAWEYKSLSPYEELEVVGANVHA